jgi:hypothetical protein
MNLNELTQKVHIANAKWWQDQVTQQPIKRNKGELLALVHSEISEGDEAEDATSYDDKLPHRLGDEVEMADAFIRLCDYAGGFGYDLQTPAALIGITEFESLNSMILNVHNEVRFKIERVFARGDHAGLHRYVSKLLEFERKNNPQAVNIIIILLVAIALHCERRNYDLQGAFEEKMAFNATREDHTHEARRIAGGKQF